MQFMSSPGKNLSFRTGRFDTDGRTVSTPFFLPIVNIITGPPPLFANGGVWRHIKIELLKKDKFPAIMSQILHFTDFNISTKCLDKWFEETIPDRIRDETGQSPFLFVDSGGYRLLYNTHLDIERYGFKPTVKDIMHLQARFGANAVATLDYPIPPGLNDIESKERIRKSIDNCVRTSEGSVDILGGETLVYMCVHGRDYAEARGTVSHLLNRLSHRNSNHAPMGIAIGSLVPLANTPKQVIDIVKGVMDAIRACDWIDSSSVPVHAFGVSSRMMPVLAAMGVDSFDGTTYVQQAQSLRYRVPEGHSYRSFYDMEEIDCDCRYCRSLRKEDIELTKSLLRGRSQGKIVFAGKETIKSYIYALIALHNLQGSIDLAEQIRKSATSDKELKRLLIASSKDLKMRKTWAYLARYYPEVSQLLWETGFSVAHERATSVTRKGSAQEPPIPAESQKTQRPAERVSRRVVSLTLGPEDFDLNKMDYNPESKDVLLILPCTSQKPYSASPTHRFVRRALDDAGVDRRRYSKMTLSGNYGLVPEEFEKNPKIQSYDFYLSSHDHTRIELLTDRTRRFLQRNARVFNAIVSYCTAKSYREVIERALDGIPNAVILPSPLRVRKASQFRKPENISQLTRVMQASTALKKGGSSHEMRN